MVVGESPFKDVYRLAVWGPWRHVLEPAPPGWELRASRALGHLAASVPTETRARVRANLARAFPDDAFLRAQAGLVGIACGGGDSASARADLDAGVALAPRDPLVRLARGLALRRLDDPAWRDDLAALLWLDRAAADVLLDAAD